MILDHRLAPSGDEDEMLDAGRLRLVDDVLHHRPVDDRQHFLRHRLGGGQEPRAETGDGKDGFADALHRAPKERMIGKAPSKNGRPDPVSRLAGAAEVRLRQATGPD